MKKILTALLLLVIVQRVMAQTETFDMVTYHPPKNWKKDTKQGAVLYTNVNAATGGYCIISIYAGIPSEGDAQKDFKKEWKELAVTPYKADPNAKPERTITSDGWKQLTAASNIKQDNADALIILSVFSGFGKTASILANLNDQSYLPLIDSLLANIKLDKTVLNDGKAKKPLSNAVTIKDEAGNNNASADKFGHLLIPSLKDWTMKKFSNAVTYTPNDIATGQYLEVRIIPSKPFTGTMQQALAETWNDALIDLDAKKISDGNPYNIETEKKSYKGWDYIRARGAFYANGNENNLYDIRLFVIKINNRIERIAVWGLMNIDHKTYSPWANQAYQHAIEDFFYTLQFDDWKEPPLANGVIKDEGIYGLYGGLKLSGGNLDSQFTLFFSNGQVFSGPKFPLQGFYGLNTWVEAELRTKYWGTYTLQNGKGMMKMGYGNVPIKVSGNDIIATTQNTEHKYEKFPSVDGAVFNGTYAFDGNWNGNAPSITFTNDGKFIDKGALNILNHQTMDPFNITKQPGSGTYAVKDFTLICTYTDGRKVQLVFIGQEYSKKNSSPATLTFSFNNDVLYKK